MRYNSRKRVVGIPIRKGKIIMMYFLTVILVVVLVLFAVSGVFALFGSIVGFTFGVLGSVMAVIWDIMFSPLPIIVLIVWLICRHYYVKTKQ